MSGSDLKQILRASLILTCVSVLFLLIWKSREKADHERFKAECEHYIKMYPELEEMYKVALSDDRISFSEYYRMRCEAEERSKP